MAETAVRLGAQRIWVKAVSQDRNEQQPHELLKTMSEMLCLRSQMRQVEEEGDILKNAVRYLAREAD